MSSDHSNSACAAASLDEKPAVAEERGASAVPPSEGGLAGWMTVLGAFFALFASFGQSNAFGSYQAFYAQNQLSAYSASDISWIGSLQLWTYFASGAVVGRAFDAYGPRPLLIAGTVVLNLSVFMTSLCKEYWQFILAQGLLQGVGIGLVFYPAVSSCQTHFVRLRATASSLAVTGSSAGGIVFPIILQRLFGSLGFGWAVRVSGFVTLACCLVAIVCCTTRLPPAKRQGPLLDFTPFKDAKFVCFFLGTGVACFGLYIPFFYAAPFAQDVLATSSSRAFLVISAMNAGSLVGRPIPGLIADAAGRYNVLVASTGLSGIVALALWLNVHTFGALVAFAVLYGVASGAFIALCPPCIAAISPPDRIGTYVGLTYAMLSFPSLVGTPIAGAILASQHGSYTGLIAFAGATMIAGSAIMMIVKLQLNRNPLARV